MDLSNLLLLGSHKLKGIARALLGVATCHKGGHACNRGVMFITEACCSRQGCDAHNRGVMLIRPYQLDVLLQETNRL